jgi:Ran GTPase-activating protein (RanGAP) involved in mRNA processing and transport
MKFEYCNLGDDEAHGVAEEFQRENNLLKLSLRGNHISSNGFHDICKEITKDNNSKIEVLDLSENMITDEAGQDLNELIKHPNFKMKILNLK